MIWRRNLHQSTSLTELQKAVDAYGHKPWNRITNLSIVPHALGILTTKYYMNTLVSFK